MPTRKHLLDHVSAGCPVVLDVGEPRLCVLIHLDSQCSPAGYPDGISSASGGLLPVRLGFGVCLVRTWENTPQIGFDHRHSGATQRNLRRAGSAHAVSQLQLGAIVAKHGTVAP
jgi:hypothetical protein